MEQVTGTSVLIRWVALDFSDYYPFLAFRAKGEETGPACFLAVVSLDYRVIVFLVAYGQRLAPICNILPAASAPCILKIHDSRARDILSPGASHSGVLWKICRSLCLCPAIQNLLHINASNKCQSVSIN